MTIKEKIELTINSELERHKKLKQIVDLIGDVEIEEASFYINICFNFIDFNHPTRTDVVNIMQKVGLGKWDKNSNANSIDYISQEDFIPGYKLRLWSAEPPPSCTIVETEVEVPETFIPAHKEIKQTLVCH